MNRLLSSIWVLLLLIFITACKQEKQLEGVLPQVKIHQITTDVLEDAVIFPIEVSKLGLFKAQAVAELREAGVRILWVTNLTAADQQFQKLTNFVNTAHENNMYVLSDWNIENPQINQQLINNVAMDGFVCNTALKPLNYWEEAITQLNYSKELFMLSSNGDSIPDSFDAALNTSGHKLMEQIAQQSVAPSEWHKYIQNENLAQLGTLPINYMALPPIDTNTAEGVHMFGKNKNSMIALSYCAPGLPLLYPDFLYPNLDPTINDADTIKEKRKTKELLMRLGALKLKHESLDTGDNPATYEFLRTENENILAFRRQKGEDVMTFVANLGDEDLRVPLDIRGSWMDVTNNYMVMYAPKDQTTIGAHRCLIFTNIKTE